MLLDVTANDTYPQEYATFDFSLFDEPDIAKIKIGAIFKWLITESSNQFIFNSNVFTKENIINASNNALRFKDIIFS